MWVVVQKTGCSDPNVVLNHFWSGKMAQRHNYTPHTPLCDIQGGLNLLPEVGR